MTHSDDSAIIVSLESYKNPLEVRPSLPLPFPFPPTKKPKNPKKEVKPKKQKYNYTLLSYVFPFFLPSYFYLLYLSFTSAPWMLPPL